MRHILFLMVMLSTLTGVSRAAGVAVVDDVGREVSLERPAQRIVSLAPHATELLFAAGAGESVVGVSDFTTWPPEADQLPGIGGGAGLDLEAIIALQPDLLVAWYSGNPRAQLQRLEAFGLNVFYSEPATLEALASNIERLGQLAGTEGTAAIAAAEFRQGVEALRAGYAQREPVTVFYQIWERPLMTINGNHLISRWLQVCGAKNIFADLPDLGTAIDEEAVLEADPQVLVAGYYPGKGEGWRERWMRWPDLRAVAEDHLYTVPAETMERQTPRALQAARELCIIIDAVRRD